MDFICNREQFFSDKSRQSKIQAIEQSFNDIRNFKSSVFSNTDFLKNFYIQEETLTYQRPVSTYVLNCYERLLDYWLNERTKRVINKIEMDLATKLYERKIKTIDNSLFKGLENSLNIIIRNAPLVITVLLTGYIINAIKK